MSEPTPQGQPEDQQKKQESELEREIRGTLAYMLIRDSKLVEKLYSDAYGRIVSEVLRDLKARGLTDPKKIKPEDIENSIKKVLSNSYMYPQTNRVLIEELDSKIWKQYHEIGKELKQTEKGIKRWMFGLFALALVVSAGIGYAINSSNSADIASVNQDINKLNNWLGEVNMRSASNSQKIQGLYNKTRSLDERLNKTIATVSGINSYIKTQMEAQQLSVNITHGYDILVFWKLHMNGTWAIDYYNATGNRPADHSITLDPKLAAQLQKLDQQLRKDYNLSIFNEVNWQYHGDSGRDRVVALIPHTKGNLTEAYVLVLGSRGDVKGVYKVTPKGYSDVTKYFWAANIYSIEGLRALGVVDPNWRPWFKANSK